MGKSLFLSPLLFLLLLLLASLLLLTACRGEGTKGRDRLEITSYLAIGGKEQEKIVISCKQSEGCIPDAFRQVKLDPVPAGAACTRIYGGPQQIALRGQVNGERIDSQFNLAGGCEIARFESLQPLLRELGVSQEELFPEMPSRPLLPR